MEALDFGHQRLSLWDWNALSCFLPQHRPALTTLRFAWSQRLDGAHLRWIQGSLKFLAPVLRVLDLSYTRLGTEGIRIVASALHGSPSLEELGLGSCHLNSGDGVAIASILASCPNLLNLQLPFNDLRAVGLRPIASVIAAKRPPSVLAMHRANVRAATAALEAATRSEHDDGGGGAPGVRSGGGGAGLDGGSSLDDGTRSDREDRVRATPVRRDGMGLAVDDEPPRSAEAAASNSMAAAAFLAEAGITPAPSRAVTPPSSEVPGLLPLLTAAATMQAAMTTAGAGGAASAFAGARRGTAASLMGATSQGRRGGAAGATLEPLRLTSLNLRANSLGPAGAAVLGAALRGNTALVKLNVADNRITAAGATKLGLSLLAGGRSVVQVIRAVVPSFPDGVEDLYSPTLLADASILSAKATLDRPSRLFDLLEAAAEAEAEAQMRAEARERRLRGESPPPRFEGGESPPPRFEEGDAELGEESAALAFGEDAQDLPRDLGE